VADTPVARKELTVQDGYRIRYAFGSSSGIVRGDGADWFGPLDPIAPVAPAEVAGRRLDFPSGYNLELQPRISEPIGFKELRALADGYDILRLIVETRKDQMEQLDFQFQPRLGTNGKPVIRNAEGDERFDRLYKFFHRPDGTNYWNTWLRMLLEDMFVIDAATLYRRRTRGGQLFALEPIDGATIKRIIDDWGRTPAPPAPAYQQVLKGFPAVNYTTRDLIYLPRNVRVNRFYGYSPVEQVITTVNIALRRQLYQLQYFTEGNVPEALIGTPDNWTPEQIQRFQDSFDALLSGNQAVRRRAKFVPGGVAKTFIPTKEPELTGKMDEWLARVCCFAFSVSPQCAVSMMNRATAESAHQAALKEGLLPVMNWVKRVVDRIIEEDFGFDDIEFKWCLEDSVDPKVQMDTLTGYVRSGILKVNEARARIGEEPEDGGEELRVQTSAGMVKITVNDDTPPEQRKTPGQDGEEPTSPTGDGKEAAKSDRPFVDTGRGGDRRRKAKPMTHETPHVRRAEIELARAYKKALRAKAEAAAQAAAHAYEALEKASQDDIDSVVDAAVAAMDTQGWAVLVDLTADRLREVVRAAAAEALARLGVDAGADTLEQVHKTAVEYAKQRAAELVGRRMIDGELVDNPRAEYAITDTIRDDIRDAVVDALENGLSAQELADNIQDLASFSEDRAITIGRTEIVRANNRGHVTAFYEAGVERKAWTTGGDDSVCDVCHGNEEQGDIAMDDDFESGDFAPPAHPNCRCALVPIIPDNGDDSISLQRMQAAAETLRKVRRLALPFSLEREIY
jgi:SPP1 gp7 family putative phage head morphogenesis protein